jgi:5-oxoprolinase (ATP-hydrolysing) subunit A
VISPTERTVDLNADLGEGFPWDDALLGCVSSASICCGAHAGDAGLVLQTLRTARARGVVVGAHPGYVDRPSFGRREMRMPSSEVAALIVTQLEGIEPLAELAGVRLRFLKPHGALYNQAQREEEVARGVVEAAAARQLALLGQPGSVVEELARLRGVRFVREGFADRRYLSDGRLVPRGQPGAILHDPAEIEAQVINLVDQGIDTLCLHGDDPGAVALAERLVALFQRQGITCRSFA